MKNKIINDEVNKLVDEFIDSWDKLVSNKNLISEIKKCEKMWENEDMSEEEEKYVSKMCGLCENMVGDIRYECGYWLKK